MSTMDTTALRWRARNGGLVQQQQPQQQRSRRGRFNNNNNYGAATRTKEDDQETSSLWWCCCGKNGWLFMDSVALSAVGTSLVSWGVAGRDSFLVTVSSGMTLVMGPYTAYQKRRLLELGTLRQQQNGLRKQTNGLVVENDRLNGQVQRLEGSVSRLEQTQDELNQLLPGWQNQQDRLQGVLDQTRTLQQQIRTALRRQVLESILTAVVRSDSDQDFQLTPTETELLIVRLRALPGIRFHERNFRQYMTDGDFTVAAVMQLIRKLMSDDDDTNDIITLAPQDMKKNQRNNNKKTKKSNQTTTTTSTTSAKQKTQQKE